MAIELKTNTACSIVAGPFIDHTAFLAVENSLTVTAMHVGIYACKNDQTAVMVAEFDPTASGGDNDMVHITNDDVGMYTIELTAANLNWLGSGKIVFYDVDGFLCHWVDINVVSAAYFDFKYGSSTRSIIRAAA